MNVSKKIPSIFYVGYQVVRINMLPCLKQKLITLLTIGVCLLDCESQIANLTENV